MSRWADFYRNRINSTYQDYFERKYKPLLDFVGGFKVVREEGVGIGSVSKFLLKHKVACSGFDLCPEMVKLSRLNNPKLISYVGNIFDNRHPKVSMVVTHGVLEHFPDNDVSLILQRYKQQGQLNAHYVPL